MIVRRKRHLIPALAMLAAALALIAFGLGREHRVHEPEVDEALGIRIFTRVSELRLIEDSTFSGTVRQGDMLVTTYDRSNPPGRQACPT